jgi:hypothetical protein
VNVRHTVKLQNVIIGWSDLEQRDPSLRRAWGRFRPGAGYELVQPVFHLFTEAVPLPGGEPMDEEKLERYHAARDQLGLVLEDASGRPIATSAIHIADYTERKGEEALELDVLVRDERFWAAGV